MSQAQRHEVGEIGEPCEVPEQNVVRLASVKRSGAASIAHVRWTARRARRCARVAVHEGALVDKDDDLWRAGTVGGVSVRDEAGESVSTEELTVRTERIVRVAAGHERSHLVTESLDGVVDRAEDARTHFGIEPRADSSIPLRVHSGDSSPFPPSTPSTSSSLD